VEHEFGEIIGNSDSLKRVLQEVEQVSTLDTNVLISGETGTGKDMIAHAIHNLSQRKDQLLVKVNCAALPANLIESELFGYEKGAFTGATSRKIGRFELANGGTIFLDEIGDLQVELQVKLLRVLEHGEFERLGGSRTSKVDVRIIAATNRDLEQAIKSGNFREDLYYRLNIFPIKIPPLRERKEDIPLLVTHFVSNYGAKVGKQVESVSDEALKSLMDYEWPGNIRELESVIERAVILSDERVLVIEDLQQKKHHDEDKVATRRESLEEVERIHILNTLKECNWIVEGKRGAAERLGLPPSTLRDRIRKLGITKPV